MSPLSFRYAASPSKPYYNSAAAPQQPQYVAPFGHAAPPPSQAEQPEREKFEVIPMNADKPSGIDMGDFLPDKFRFGFYEFCLRKSNQSCKTVTAPVTRYGTHLFL